MFSSANQFGGSCPHTSFFKGGQMSGGNMSYTQLKHLYNLSVLKWLCFFFPLKSNCQLLVCLIKMF